MAYGMYPVPVALFYFPPRFPCRFVDGDNRMIIPTVSLLGAPLMKMVMESVAEKYISS